MMNSNSNFHQSDSIGWKNNCRLERTIEIEQGRSAVGKEKERKTSSPLFGAV